ncbi:amidohydrolase family protein [Colwellia asteriadis]|uniref:Amidohydrolase family protein n=1 Tax=Colwellia asteriadis TaxID=517723 RepID=A0ABN1L2H1_9GAMM
MKIFDPHIHLFDLTQGDYHWLKSQNPPFWSDKALINNSFSEQSLVLQPPLTLAGFVHIEAGFNNDEPWQEINYLEQSCNKPFASVANIDLLATSERFIETLNKLISYQSLVGVRHILDEQAHAILTNEQALINFKNLNKYALIFEVQLPLADTNKATREALVKVIHDNPNTQFVINHSGFPPMDISSKHWQQWLENLASLAELTNTVIKCSGWEMCSRNYNEQWLSQCLEGVVDIFGIKRVMLASNFPLCLFSQQSYHDYWHTIANSTFLSLCSPQQKNALLCGNALKWYQVKK